VGPETHRLKSIITLDLISLFGEFLLLCNYPGFHPGLLSYRSFGAFLMLDTMITPIRNPIIPNIVNRNLISLIYESFFIDTCPIGTKYR